MKFNPACMECQIRKHENRIRHFDDENRKKEYMDTVLERFSYPKDGECVPSISVELKKYYSDFWKIPMEDFREINREFNQLMLQLEKQLFEVIQNAEDSLYEALVYARTGNYIDFAALPDVSKEKAVSLVMNEHKDPLDKEEYRKFCEEVKQAKTLVYLTDNCGEIVLDKLAIKILQQCFPKLKITVLVRGLPAGNDATMEDAEMCGLTEIVPVMGNGSDVGGTWLPGINKEARELLERADVILAKGQGNYETLHGCGLNIYYLFLCKCDYFVKFFHAKPLQGMFVNEKRVPEAK